MRKLAYLAVLSLALAVAVFGQTQHFVTSTTAGSYGGSAVSIATMGVQLVAQPTYQISADYEFISNPADSTKPRVGSGVVNYTRQASTFLPASIKSKLVIDLTNYTKLIRGGGGVQSLYNPAGGARIDHTVGNFGVYGSYPLPGGHAQVGVGYKWIVGGTGGTVKVPVGTLNFTF